MASRKDPDRVVQDFGRRVAELRVGRGWTQEQLAERAEWTVKYLQRIEAGRANLTISSLVGLGNLLRVDAQELLVPPASRKVPKGRPRRSS